MDLKEPVGTGDSCSVQHDPEKDMNGRRKKSIFFTNSLSEKKLER